MITGSALARALCHLVGVGTASKFWTGAFIAVHRCLPFRPGNLWTTTEAGCDGMNMFRGSNGEGVVVEKAGIL